MIVADDRIYRLSRKEALGCLAEGMLLNAIIAMLFYNSLLAMIPGTVIVYVYFKERKRVLAQKRRNRMRKELKEFFQALIVSLQTGRSMENAFAEALKDLKCFSREDSELVYELKRICAAVSLGETLEKQLMEFAYRSHLEELEYFAEVFSVAKRSGGNLIAIMKNTIRMIQEGMDAEEEIRTVLAEKQLEFYLMCVIPLGMIIYFRVGAGEFISALYGNPTGILVMTVCLGIYGGCVLYGQRLLEIKS